MVLNLKKENLDLYSENIYEILENNPHQASIYTIF
jgi:hypothetical protein